MSIRVLVPGKYYACSKKGKKIIKTGFKSKKLAEKWLVYLYPTGYDRLWIERKNKPDIEFDIAKLYMATSNKPKIKETDEGLWRRLYVRP